LQCVAVCYSALQCVAVRCSALQCVAVRCSALQCVAVHCSALQCIAVQFSALQCVPAALREYSEELAAKKLCIQPLCIGNNPSPVLKFVTCSSPSTPVICGNHLTSSPPPLPPLPPSVSPIAARRLNNCFGRGNA